VTPQYGLKTPTMYSQSHDKPGTHPTAVKMASITVLPWIRPASGPSRPATHRYAWTGLATNAISPDLGVTLFGVFPGRFRRDGLAGLVAWREREERVRPSPIPPLVA